MKGRKIRVDRDVGATRTGSSAAVCSLGIALAEVVCRALACGLRGACGSLMGGWVVVGVVARTIPSSAVNSRGIVVPPTDSSAVLACARVCRESRAAGCLVGRMVRWWGFIASRPCAPPLVHVSRV